MKFWITLFIFWAIFRAIKAAIEQSQKAAKGLARPKGSTQVRRTVEWTSSEEPRRVVGHEIEPDEPISQMDVIEGIRSAAKGDLGELQRLFTEAKERKERLAGAPHQPRTQATRPRPVRPRPAQPRRVEPRRSASRDVDSWIPRREPEPDEWISAHPEPDVPCARKDEVRREARPKRKRVAVPRKRVPARPDAQPTARPKQQKRRRQAKETAPRTEPAAAIPLIGKLGKNDIRRGIVIAEILGPAKALRDIDSHVI